MNILDFLNRNKKSQNLNTKTEDSDKDKTKKELMLKNYNRAYLFYGDYENTIEINNQTITYSHRECFLADSKYFEQIKNFIRLTGDNVDSKPLDIKSSTPWVVGKYSGTKLTVEDNELEYTISSSDCLDESWLNNHNISGHDIAKKVDDINNLTIKHQCEQINEQNEIDSIFEK